MIRTILLGALALLMTSCATNPGPRIAYVGGMTPRQVMETMDEVTEFGNYPAIDAMKGCPNLLDLTDMYDSGILKLHKAGYYETSTTCNEMAFGLHPTLASLLTLSGSGALACTKWEFSSLCNPLSIDVYYFPDQNNGMLEHELWHAKGIADEFYGEIKED